MSRSPVYLALLHGPVYNKRMEVITTSVTNLDIHDISRASRTYGIETFFLVHPLEAQRNLVAQMSAYWRQGFGSEYNPDRKDALGVLAITASFEEAVARITEKEGLAPIVVATDARPYPNQISYRELRKRFDEDGKPVLLLFGTGWGLTAEFMQSCDLILDPVNGPTPYNHLSVRSAVSIILDRLLGEVWWE
ncbi:MAG: RNA methyltransferase [Solirubrobacterales bacterium]